MKKSKLYTRTGDSGTTALVSGNRVSKTHSRIEAYGTIDELNSHIGMLAALLQREATAQALPMLTYIQHRLFDLGAYLATDPDALSGEYPAPPPPSAAQVERLEQMTDEIDSQLPPLRQFVLPGGTTAAAEAHITRTVCRRAERRMLSLNEQATVSPEALKFINRLSDLLFAIARWCNIKSGRDEIFWDKNC